jgi:hypothetical protein
MRKEEQIQSRITEIQRHIKANLNELRKLNKETDVTWNIQARVNGLKEENERLRKLVNELEWVLGAEDGVRFVIARIAGKEKYKVLRISAYAPGYFGGRYKFPKDAETQCKRLIRGY